MKYNHKTIAKTISYIGYHSPGEYGLFWDEDGTMPWKEFHWALQQEPDLRFVRASTLHELQQLGYSLPFILEGRLLKLREDTVATTYPVVQPPSRLYCACLRRSFQHVQEFGLVANQRGYVPLASQQTLAVLIAKRRDSQPILLDVQASKAHDDGIAFRQVGEHLYLVRALPPRYLVFPLISTRISGLVSRSDHKDHRLSTPTTAASAGSFQVNPEHLRGSGGENQQTGRSAGKPDKSRDWKRDSRRLRDKRKV